MDTPLTNIRTLNELDGGLYPELYRLMRTTSLRAHLARIWTYIHEHERPRTHDSEDTGYWSIPVSYLVRTYGGSFEVWQSHIVFAVDAGLLARIKPDSRTHLHHVKMEYEAAKRAHRTPASFYKIVKYTPQVLAQAEQTAQRYRACRQSISHITKADVIRVSGHERANMIYRDTRKISDQEQRIRRQIGKVIADQIAKKGYTTMAEVETEYKLNLLDELWSGGNWAIYSVWRKTWTRRTALVKDLGYSYHTPTRDEMERYGLTSRAWIIAPEPKQKK